MAAATSGLTAPCVASKFSGTASKAVGNSLGEQPAGTGFCRRDRLSPLGEQRNDRVLECLIVDSVYRVAKSGAQRLLLGSNQRFSAEVVAGVGGDAQVAFSEFGKRGDAGVVREQQIPGHFFDLAFAQADYSQDPRLDNRSLPPQNLSKIRKDALLYHGDELVRRPGQTDYDFSILFNKDSWGRSVRVGQTTPGDFFGDERLLIESAGRAHCVLDYNRLKFGEFDRILNKRDIEDVADGLFSEVIHCGAQAAARDEQVASAQRLPDRVVNAVDIVANRGTIIE